jgi:hypothetical protein
MPILWPRRVGVQQDCTGLRTVEVTAPLPVGRASVWELRLQVSRGTVRNNLGQGVMPIKRAEGLGCGALPLLDQARLWAGELWKLPVSINCCFPGVAMCTECSVRTE